MKMIDLPEGWGDDQLSEFINLASKNIFATFANLRGTFRRLKDIDTLFCEAARHLNNQQHWFPALFLLKSHSAYRAAVRLSMSGQVSESYMVMRGCLENSLYALYFFNHPKSAEIWLSRQDSEKAKCKVKGEFQIGKMLQLLDNINSRLGKIMRILYERVIEYGAHPNSPDLLTNMKLIKNNKDSEIQVVYLRGDDQVLRASLKSCAQVGVISLNIFKLIFEIRFGLSGITNRLKKVSVGI